MSEEIVKKDLPHNATLKFWKYELEKGEAEALDRPVGSYEIVLAYEAKPVGHTMNPTMSWKVDEQVYRRLFDAIKDKEGYDKAEQFLIAQATSPADAPDLDTFLETL